MKNKDNLLGVLATLIRWKKQIITISSATLVLSAAASWFLLDNYYQSTTIFYVASPDLFKPEQMFGTSTKDMEYYGTENDVDRTLTIAQSGELYDFLIRTFKLYEHYGIDSTATRASFKVREALEGLYNVQKTKFNAIEVSVEDKDPQFAALMANAARNKIDEIAQRLIRNSQYTLLKAYENDIFYKNQRMSGIGDTLSRMRSTYGVIDPALQTENVTRIAAEAEGNYYRTKARYELLAKSAFISKDTLALLEGNLKGYEEEWKRSLDMMKKYNEGYNSVAVTKEMFEQERYQLSRDKQRYLQIKTAYETKVSALHLVEAAQVPLIKSRPKRMVLVASATFIAVIFSILGALLLDTYRHVNWKELVDETAD